MKAEIITIGDELLIGQVVDTNSAWMAEQLNKAGMSLYQITSVHDDREHIMQAVDDAINRVDIVLTTGGLGPTKDDITKNILCEYFHTKLIPSTVVRDHVRDLYKERPEILNRLTETQWLVPENCEVLENRVGSAPIMLFHTLRNEHEITLISMPGVPYEMEIAMKEQVLPRLSQMVAKGQFPIIHKTLLLSGIPESSLAIRIEEWENSLPRTIHLAYLPKDGTIRLRLSSYGEASEEEIDEQIKNLIPLINDFIVLKEDVPLEVALGELLKQKNATISTAESCTGGKLASLLNKHAGSSAFYFGSVVSYDNSIKEHILGVSPESIKTHDVVSEEAVREMANNVRKLCNTDYAIATSGIAGPGGGTPEKPVGTVWIAWATPHGTYAECFHLGKIREQITNRACVKALIKMIELIRQDK